MLGLNYLAWIGIVSWIIVPLLALLATVLIWRRARSGLRRALALVAGFAILSVPTLVSNGVKTYYDQQVREMCAKDGGVRVYETVTLPAEKFDELKRKNFVLPDKTRTEPVDEYYSETDCHYYREGNPEISRRQYRIIRRSDQKILGELVFYGRAGGDLPGPWYGSSFTCPNPTQVRFESAIFIRGDKQ